MKLSMKFTLLCYHILSITTSMSFLIPITRYNSNFMKSRTESSHISFHTRNKSNISLFNSNPLNSNNNEDILLPISSSSSSRSDFIKSSVLSLITMSTVSNAQPASAVTNNPLKSSSELPRQSPSSPSSSIISSSTIEEAISGFISGAAVVATKTIVKYPLDTAAVRLQMPKNNTSIEPTIQELFQDSYRGILIPLAGNIPAGSVFFAVKDSMKSMLKSNTDFILPKWLITTIAVAIAIPPYWLLRNPTEVVKTRQQAKIQGYDDSNALQAYQRTWEDAKKMSSKDSNVLQPLSAFYSGFIENMLYSYPADVIKFLIYEVFFSNGNIAPTPLEGAAYGAFSTSIAQFITTPLDVVRNRIMTGTTDKQQELSYFQTLSKIAREEGVQGLFSGATPRIGKAFLSGAIQFAAYEETKVAVNSFLKR